MDFASNYSSQAIRVIPISALEGDNVVTPSANMPWYEGPTLLEHMETVPIRIPDKGAFRFPVQSVIRPNQDFRGYAGQVISGMVSVGEEVVAFPSLLTSKVRSIVTADGELQTARAGDAVVITLEDEIDISRGNIITGLVNEPALTSEFEVDLCWLGDHPHRLGKHYVLMHGTDQSGAVLEDDIKLVDIETLETEPAATLKRNDIAKAVITSFKPLPLDLYKTNRAMGAMLLIDPDTNVPAAAAMVTKLITTSENLSALAI
jgi:bifunctional enzyme CysN/CysC